MGPDYWTVFNAEKAAEAARAAAGQGREQALLARIQAPGDTFYSGHEGGFGAGAVEAAADALDRTPGGRFAGLTTFPALLYDRAAARPGRPPISRPCTRPRPGSRGRTGRASSSMRQAPRRRP